MKDEKHGKWGKNSTLKLKNYYWIYCDLFS